MKYFFQYLQLTPLFEPAVWFERPLFENSSKNKRTNFLAIVLHLHISVSEKLIFNYATACFPSTKIQ